MQNFEGSAIYWESRYKSGRTSGAGSYGILARFKADIINNYIKKNNIDSVAELGCGDGNQLILADYKHYTGFDVSETAISICKSKFAYDKSKTFLIYNGTLNEEDIKKYKSDLAISLDVIYHLVEDSVYETYLQTLFSLSNKHVIIYSSNFDDHPEFNASYILHRKFTDYIKDSFDSWSLAQVVKNAYPFDKRNPNETTLADFYIYERCK